MDISAVTEKGNILETTLGFQKQNPTLSSTHFSEGHVLFKWSKILIVGPHRSLFSSPGQRVTVGKFTLSSAHVSVSDTVG